MQNEIGNHKLVICGDEVSLLNEDGETKTSLKKGVGMLAMSVYAEMLDMKSMPNDAERERLEKKIYFQSEVLDSLSNALLAIKG